MKLLSVVSLCVLLSACMSPPVDQAGRKLSLADAGSPPGDVEKVVRDALRYRLKDFDSAKIELPFSPRPVVFAKAPGLNSGGAGWEICPRVNAKNSYGGYTGFKTIFILWNQGEVIDFNASDMADFWCRDKNDARIEVGNRMK